MQNRRTWIGSIVLLVVIAVAFAGCGGDEGGSITITIDNFSFGAEVTVPVGTELEVVNEDSVAHTFTAVEGAFDSGTIAAGESFAVALTEPGTYDFFCVIHPGMQGSVTVTG